MTVPVPGSLTYTYVEDGVTTVFPYPVRFLEPGELTVVRENSDGAQATLIYNVDYTVSGAGNPAGGSITRTAVTSGGKITITRDTAAKQLVDLKDGQRNPAEAVELQLDRLAMVDQDQGRDIGRSLKLAVGAPVLPEGHFPEAAADGSMRDGGSSVDIKNAQANAEIATGAADRAEAAAAGVNLPSVTTGDALKQLIVNNDESGYLLAPASAVAVELFGAVGDGVTDDSAAIQAAIDAVAAKGGGIVRLAGKTYALSGKISQKSAVRLVGQGSCQYPRGAYATDTAFLALPKTRLIAKSDFPSNTPMIDATVVRGPDAFNLQGIGLEGVMLDCAGVADIGFSWRGVKHSAMRDVLVYRPTTNRTSRGGILDTAQGAITGATALTGSDHRIGLAIASSPRDDWYVGATITITGGTGAGQSRTITAYLGSTRVADVDTSWDTIPDATSIYSITGEVTKGTGDSNFNIFERVTIWLGTTGFATGWEFDGDGVADPNQNTYLNCAIVHADGPGIRAKNGDTERFIGLSTYAFGVGSGLLAYGSDVASYEGYCRDNIYEACLFGGAQVGHSTGTAQAGSSTTITLALSASSVDDYYVDKIITLTGGTGANQMAVITGYVGSTKVATVKTAWAKNPNATTTYTIPNGGGTTLLPGSYADSAGHRFPNAAINNGAVAPLAMPGAWSSWDSDIETFKGGYNGHVLSIASQRPFVGGMKAQFKYQGTTVGGAMVDYARIDGVAIGAGGSENGVWNFYTRSTAGTMGLNFSIGGGGVAINGGTVLKRVLRVAAQINWDSIPANSSDQTKTVTVTGAEIGDIVCLGPPNNGYASGLTFDGYVSAANTVTVRATNATTSAIDPGNLFMAVAVLGF